MRDSLRWTGAGLLALALLAGGPAGAIAPRPVSDTTQYVRARAAGVAGDLDAAAQGFAGVLANDPTNTDLALRTLRQAVAAGDAPIAVRSARLIEAHGTPPGDARLVLLTDAMTRRDWRVADAQVAGVAADPLYGFMAPILRAWVGVAEHRPDPLAPLATVTAEAAALAAQARMLGLLAQGNVEEGVKLARSLPLKGPTLIRLRLIAADALARSGQKDRALDLILGDEPIWTAGRAQIIAGKRLGGRLDADMGLAETFIAVAETLDRVQASQASLGFARLATMLAPDDASGWLLASDRLSVLNQREAALALTDHVAADGPYDFARRSLRVALLVALERKPEAVAEAAAMTARPSAGPIDWIRRGDLLSQVGRFSDAADAYGHAIALQKATKPLPDAIWPLLMLRSGAWLQANDWPAAKADLAAAYALAPNEAVVLNSWGYSQLERRENVANAAALVERASKLRPDDPAITDSLGWTYYLRGAYDKAVPVLERASAADPDEPTINEHLGDAYWRNGRRLEARYAWRAAQLTADDKDKPRLTAKLDQGWSEATGSP